MSGRLLVDVHRARGLVKTDVFALSDPYCTVTFQNVQKRTRTIKDTLNPEWNESFSFDVDPNGQKGLFFVCLDEDLTSKDDLQGQSGIDISFFKNNNSPRWIGLSGGQAKRGELYVLINWDVPPPPPPPPPPTATAPPPTTAAPPPAAPAPPQAAFVPPPTDPVPPPAAPPPPPTDPIPPPTDPIPPPTDPIPTPSDPAPPPTAPTPPLTAPSPPPAAPAPAQEPISTSPMTQQRDFEVPPDIIRVFITNFNGVDKPYEFRLDWTLLQVKTILGEVLSTPAGNLVLTDAANNVALSADLRTLGELGIENLGRLSVTSVLSGIQLTSVHVVLIRRNGTTFSFDMVTEENATVGQVKSDIVTRVGRDIERAQMAQGVGNQGTGTGAGAGVVSFDIFVKVDGKLVASGDDGKSIRECFAGGNEDNVVFVVL